MPNPEDTLTPREFEMVALLVRGLRYVDIAREMRIGEETVKTYCKRVREKTGMENMVAVAVWFVRRFPTEDDEAKAYEDVCEAFISKGIHRNFYGLTELGK